MHGHIKLMTWEIITPLQGNLSSKIIYSKERIIVGLFWYKCMPFQAHDICRLLFHHGDQDQNTIGVSIACVCFTHTL